MPLVAAQPDMLLSAKDVAELLSVSKRCVWLMVSQGKIPQPIRITKRLVRWKATELQKYLDSLN